MDCCLLSAEEVGRLTHYGLYPNHSEHRHLPAVVAIAGIKDETYQLITFEGRNYVTPSLTYFIRALPSGTSRIKVIQRVKMNHVKELKPIR